MLGKTLIADRYEIQEALGEGGMGVVYRALDTRTKSYVALKTMRDATDSQAVELFAKEWSVLANISHPNIVDIRDVGEIEEKGQRKPFFVMPLLPGATLSNLIESGTHRLTVERVIDIIVQACRGLHAAHERGLVHRDIKPSNILVMDDDTVKIIDFGVVHLAGTHTSTGYKGTLQYMAPEQMEEKSATSASDIFSLGVVCYEALTGRKAFARKTLLETAQAIRNYIPPPISVINSTVPQLVSMAVHKAMAKQPLHRFSSARDFAETLQKALLNQPIERFDKAKIQSRLERVKKAFSEGDLGFAAEILTELEAEGNIDPEIFELRSEIDGASRQKKIRQLLESARTRVEQDEHPLALEKLQEVLDIDPENADALSMRSSIEKQRSDSQIESWMNLARRHLERHDFAQARQALQEVFKLDPGESSARNLLRETDRREQDVARVRSEKEELYGLAKGAYEGGEISTALSKLERILELERQSPDAAVPERDAVYENFYKQVRSERDAIHNGYEECRRQLSEKNFARALELCDSFLAKYSNDPLFHALKIETVERQRQQSSEYIAEIGKRIDAEADLDRRVNILKEACERYPQEQQFQQSLKLISERRDLVASIVSKARQFEERGQFTDAIGQWDIVRNIYPRYPGIDFEVDQLSERRERQAREGAKSRTVEQIDRALEGRDFQRAVELAGAALSEYPGDQELDGLERLARQGLERILEARKLYDDARALTGPASFDAAIAKLRQASKLDESNELIRGALVNALVEKARPLSYSDWAQAESILREAEELDTNHPGVRALRLVIADAKRKDFLSNCLANVREQQLNGKLDAALEQVEQGLAQYPSEVRLLQLQSTLQTALRDTRRRDRGRTESVANVPSLPTASGATLGPAALSDSTPTELVHGPVAQPEVPSVNTKSAGDAVESTPPAAPIASTIGTSSPSVSADIPQGHDSVPVSPLPPPPAKRGFSGSRIAIAGAALLLIVAVIVATTLRKPKPAPAENPVAASTKISVQIQTTPADAVVTVDGAARSGTIELDSAKAYDVSVARPGYRALRQNIRPAAEWKFHLEPEPVRLRVSTAEKTGKVFIDGKEMGELREGALPDLEIPPDAADHVFSLKNGASEILSFHFKAEPAEYPRVSSVQPRDLIVVSSLGTEALVYSGSRTLRANLSGQEPQSIPEDGLKLTGLSMTNHELAFSVKDIPSVPIEIGNAPILYATLNADPNVGYLYLQTPVETAHLLINGQEVKTTRKGIWWIWRRPGKYAVKLTADGYNDFEEEMEVVKGAPVQRKIELKQKPVFASLMIQGGTPGADVLIDGDHLGTLDSSGAFRYDRLAPGQHQISIRKDLFEPSSPATHTFSAGQTVTLATESRLKPFGTLTVQVTPADAQLSYRHVDRQEVHAFRAGESISVPEGRYEITGKADGYTGRSLPDVNVVSGKPTAVQLTLAAIEKKQPEAVGQVVTVPGLFETPARLEQVGDWWNGKGSGYVFLKPDVHRFTISFAKAGKNFFGKSKKFEWVVHYVDDREKIVYEIDGGKLTRKITAAGIERKTVSALEAGAAAFVTVNVAVDSSGVVIASPSGAVIDTYVAGNQDLTKGKIGIKTNTVFSISK